MAEKIPADQPLGEALDLLEGRRSMYAFLARVFEKEVTIDFLKQCTEEEGPLLQVANPGNLKEGTEEDKEIGEGFNEMSTYLKGTSGRDIEKVKLELDIEYANLFLGIVGKPPHPSESVYSSEEHLLMQRARDEVMFTYRSVGVDKVAEFTEPEDHIAIELQFMAYLCQKTSDATKANDKTRVEKYLNVQKEFVKKHLGTWVPDLTKDILESGKIGFYTGAAKIMDGLIKTEPQSIDFLIEQMLA